MTAKDPAIKRAKPPPDSYRDGGERQWVQGPPPLNNLALLSMSGIGVILIF